MARYAMSDTLSNVSPGSGGKTAENEQLIGAHPPSAYERWVSLGYEYDPQKSWYVLRATYGREKKAYDYIVNDGTIAYLPLHYIEKRVLGRKKRILAPLLPNLLFVYADKSKIDEYVKQTPKLSFLRYYFNHLETDANGTNPPLTIAYSEMNNFIDVTSVDDTHLKVVDLSQCHFKSGDKVRITGGAFAGVQGYVARVAGQQRVVVTIEGLCSVATAYIPTAFIETI